MSQYKIKTIHPNDPYREIIVAGQPAISSTEPDEAWEGMDWYNPNTGETKKFLDGQFRDLGSGNGNAEVIINIDGGNADSIYGGIEPIDGGGI